MIVLLERAFLVWHLFKIVRDLLKKRRRRIEPHPSPPTDDESTPGPHEDADFEDAPEEEKVMDNQELRNWSLDPSRTDAELMSACAGLGLLPIPANRAATITELVGHLAPLPPAHAAAWSPPTAPTTPPPPVTPPVTPTTPTTPPAPPQQPIVIVTSSPLTPAVSGSYAVLLQVTGGQAPYRWTSVGLPQWLVLDGNGLLHGLVPQGAQQATFVATVADSSNQIAHKAFEVPVQGSQQLTPTQNVTCSQCGTVNNAGARFCQTCGQTMSGNVPTQTASLPFGINPESPLGRMLRGR